VSSDKPSIRLHGTGLAVILSYPSGIEYYNQVGGYSTNTGVHEGIYVPLKHVEYHDWDKKRKDHEEFLFDYFFGETHSGWCTNGISEEDADYLDNEFFAKFSGMDVFKVNRSMLKECKEAWIHVIISDPIGMLGYSPKENTPKNGVITWLNSD
jgi:hypothetical protein